MRKTQTVAHDPSRKTDQPLQQSPLAPDFHTLILYRNQPGQTGMRGSKTVLKGHRRRWCALEGLTLWPPTRRQSRSERRATRSAVLALLAAHSKQDAQQAPTLPRTNARPATLARFIVVWGGVVVSAHAAPAVTSQSMRTLVRDMTVYCKHPRLLHRHTPR
eukprot:582642-Rhodomonas_salina.3